jgi:hypothetical protein
MHDIMSRTNLGVEFGIFKEPLMVGLRISPKRHIEDFQCRVGIILGELII